MENAVEKMAKLARISISSEEVQTFSHDLQGLLNWFEQLQTVDITGLQSATHPEGESLLLRDDEIQLANTVEDLMRNAPSAKHNMFCVPKVVE